MNLESSTPRRARWKCFAELPPDRVNENVDSVALYLLIPAVDALFDLRARKDAAGPLD